MRRVDGNLTLDGRNVESCIVKAPLIIPMHFFQASVRASSIHAAGLRVRRARFLGVSPDTLPAKPKVLVLPGH